jgi:hypothetical protein
MAARKMLSLEGVVIPINQQSDLEVIAGSDVLDTSPLEPFNESVCDLLSELSRRLLVCGRRFPDITTFAFWSRRANINLIRGSYSELDRRLGLGVLLHVAPANVPINFAFSYAFGLLAGNSNIVRVPSKSFPQIDIVSAALKELLLTSEFSSLAHRTALVRYSRNEKVTARLSRLSNGRLIWGGDDTVERIRAMPAMPRTVDVAFADRYSICVLSSMTIASLDDDQLDELASGFFNDTYLMDQNACSSPHLVIWVGPLSQETRSRFWSAVRKRAERRYEVEYIQAVNRFVQACSMLIEREDCVRLYQDSNVLWRLDVPKPGPFVDRLRGNSGLFSETRIDTLQTTEFWQGMVNARFQTMTYFGVDRERLLQLIINNRLAGIDRIVPVGRALEMGLIWDGYDLIRTLSRLVALS